MILPIPVQLAVTESQNQFNINVQYLPQQYSLEVNVPVITNLFPAYTGAYSFTPSNQQQILNTTNKVLMQDIVINPIPRNYGLITWDGSILHIS